MRTLTADRLKAMLDQNEKLTLINVLSEEDFQKVHIPGSKNVPEDTEDFVRRVEQLVDSKDSKIVVYCSSTECQASPKAARKLAQAGFTQVFEFEGGIAEWRKARYDVVRDTVTASTKA